MCRGATTPIETPKTGLVLESWHQLISAMLATGCGVAGLFKPGLLAGEENPMYMAFVEPSMHAELVDWLIFTRFQQVVLQIHCT